MTNSDGDASTSWGPAPGAVSALTRSAAPADAVAAFALDAAGRVASWTAGAQRLLGWSAAEVLGQRPPVPLPTAEVAPVELLDAPVVWETAGGAPRELAVSLTPTVAADGRPAGAIVVARDISARDLTQEQLESYARDLREIYGRELHRLVELEEMSVATVQALATAVEAKDGTTGEHIRRVHALGLLLAAEIVPDEVDDPQMAYGFLLHDIGKLVVPDAVLTKPGELDPGEWELMRAHPEAGARILRPVPFLDRAIDVVLHHHERWDGGGYPHGLRGEEIPIWARIFAIVDTVDAMTSDRPYRAALPLPVATAEVRRMAGAQFDPACVEAFVALDPSRVAALLEPHGSG